MITGLLTLADGRRYWQRLERGEGMFVFVLTPEDGIGPCVLIQGSSSMTVDEFVTKAEDQLQPRRAPKRRLAGS